MTFSKRAFSEFTFQVAMRMPIDYKAFVNLIPLHPGGAGNFTPSSPEQIHWFARRLRAQGVEVAIRKSRGMDIAAACGQLRVERQRGRTPIAAEQDGNIQVA